MAPLRYPERGQCVGYGGTQADALKSYDGTAFTYNAYGYPTSYYNGSDYTFSWDKYGNLSGSTVEGVAQSYTYDADGQRRTKTANGVTSTYYYSGNTLLAQINSNDTSLLFHYDESGNPVGFTRRVNGTPYNYYYVTNLQGDVIQIVNGDFNVVCNYYYDAWGAIRKITDGSGNDITNSTNQYSVAYLNPIRYRGYYYDVETGLYYLQTRYYDPEIGCFISRDSYEYIGTDGDLGSFNLFAYCSNNPVNSYDPSGTDDAVSILQYVWWLPVVDGALPLGDIALGAVAFADLVLLGMLVDNYSQSSSTSVVVVPSYEIYRPLPGEFDPGPEGIIELGTAGARAEKFRIKRSAGDSADAEDMVGIEFKNRKKTDTDIDPHRRPGQKKQNRERKEKKKRSGWDPNPNKRIQPPKKHTPGRDHRKYK